MSFDPIIWLFQRSKSTNTKVAITTKVVRNNRVKELGNVNAYQFRGNGITYIYEMDYYKATKKHDLDLYLLTWKDPHYREKIKFNSKCVYIVKG